MLQQHVQSQVHRILIRTSLQQQPQRPRTSYPNVFNYIRGQRAEPGRGGGTRRFRMDNGMQEETKTLSRSAYLKSDLIFPHSFSNR
jgi:hypothetical protein